MYGNFSGSDESLHEVMAGIQISDVRERSEKGDYRNSRIGQLIRNDLLDRITPEGASGTVEYILKVEYKIEEEGYGIRADESVTLQNLKLLVSYELRTADKDELIMNSSARGIVTYDLVQSDYSNMIARKSVLERLSKEVAHQISIKIGTFLKKTQDTK
jgi:LPS-assembly lipoprotein